MAVGTGAETAQNIPNVNYVTDPGAFMNHTSRNIDTPRSIAAPGEGGFRGVELPPNGILSKLFVIFDGTITVDTADAVAGVNYPYGLLSEFGLTVNGQNDLWNCDGLDLHTLRFTRYPSYDELIDDFEGSVGGGDTIAVGAHDTYLTWEVPIAIDDTSLVGSLYAQSAATSIQAKIKQALNADLFSTNPGNVTIEGTFYVTTVWFDIPVGGDGKLIIPDLSMLHGFNAVNHPYGATGPQRTELIRNPGQLSRLFISAQAADENRLSALPSAAATKAIDELRLEYGGNRSPYEARLDARSTTSTTGPRSPTTGSASTSSRRTRPGTG